MKKIKRFFLRVLAYIAKDPESRMKNEIKWTLEEHPYVKLVHIEKVYTVATYITALPPDKDIEEEIYDLELSLIKKFPGGYLDFSIHKV